MYTGEALDQKTPLLRSMEAVNKQALRLIRLFGNTTSKKVTASVGPEQEYFIVDREKYLKRKDLIFTGRTLFGAMPPKGQEMDDHYFGAIRERIAAYMRDVNKELWKLGVSAKTQHNEVAPAQHELAPIYASANVAADHNQLVMETLKKVAGRHGIIAGGASFAPSLWSFPTSAADSRSRSAWVSTAFNIQVNTKRNWKFSCGVTPGSSRLIPSSVVIDQLLCLPDPFTPANGFS